MLTIRLEKSSDAAAREALLDAAYGPVRFEKPSERLRSDRAPACGLSFVAVENGRVIGTVRLWHVSAGPASAALLLGPLAVDPAQRCRGIGSALMRHALRAVEGDLRFARSKVESRRTSFPWTLDLRPSTVRRWYGKCSLWRDLP